MLLQSDRKEAKVAVQDILFTSPVEFREVKEERPRTKKRIISELKKTTHCNIFSHVATTKSHTIRENTIRENKCFPWLFSLQNPQPVILIDTEFYSWKTCTSEIHYPWTAHSIHWATLTEDNTKHSIIHRRLTVSSIQ